jgi:hypothetical protein
MFSNFLNIIKDHEDIKVGILPLSDKQKSGVIVDITNASSSDEGQDSNTEVQSEDRILEMIKELRGKTIPFKSLRKRLK